MNKRKIYYYVYSKKLVEISKNIPNIGIRAAVVQSLIVTYDLFSKFELTSGEEATDEDLLTFHSSDYLECLKEVQESSDLERITESDEVTDFNLGYDCPLFENIYEFVKLIAGSSLAAAKKIVDKNFQVKKRILSNVSTNSQPKSYLRFKNNLKVPKNSDVFDLPVNLTTEESDVFEERDGNDERATGPKYEMAFTPVDSQYVPVCINWFGGWHHAQRDEAGGFCYVNDIVIAIQYLLKFFNRILYVDLDIHHGNGVENAFLFSKRVLTFSLHKYEPGFYPATGSIEDVGEGNGKYYSVNVPLKCGITDDKYVKVFEEIASKIMEKYKPQCVVVQCGADCLAGDPLGGFNLTSVGVGKCLKFVLNRNLPTLVLGGGGYNIPNVARCWAYLTSVALECSISNDIPDNSFLHLYGPEFELGITPSLRKDENSDEYLQAVVSTILRNLDNLPEITVT